ncbi:MAG: phosphotransferase [Gammaproteobacteria bacterium]|nr:phosphotransferase [Gammaproteobacteria bacterium]
MQIPSNIRDNLRFLIAEVSSQISNLKTYFQSPSVTVAKRILDRSGYAYNLKMRIQDSCLSNSMGRKGGEVDSLSFRAIESIATDLERIAELCRDTVHQVGYLRNRQCLRYKRYLPLFDLVQKGISLIEEVIESRDTRLALKIGRIEQKIDGAYRKLRKRYTAELRRKRDTEDLISALFVAQSVEQMGDALLTISEAMISVNLGQPIDMERYYSMKESVENMVSEARFSNLVIEPIAETRSGSGISGISKADDKGDNGYVAIYKDGKKRKLKEEREGVESWHEIYPGLAPKILSYKKRGESASLLIEHLAGQTFEQILLHEPRPLLQKTLKQLSKTLTSVWRETRLKKPVSADYMGQLAKRLDEIYRIHPEFRQGDSRINGFGIPSFDTLQRRAKAYEKQLKAPFSVYIHGDFNVDNIIYDPLEKRINFIDLHRSRYMDYVQDVSVFMVSNYRLQVLDVRIRRRIMDVATEFYRFSRRFADNNGDRSFELRLALALARSFATSTRFILDQTLAQAMFLRARYLIEKLLETDPANAKSFRVPIEEIFVD